MATTTTADTATTVAAEEAEAAEAVEEYESDPEEVKRSLAMRRRREASDDEDDEESGERGKMDRAPVHSDYESDGQGGAPADYDDEFEEEDEEEDYEDEELEVEVYEEEERKQERGVYAETKVKAVEDTDGEGRMDGAVDEALRNNDNEKNDVTEGMDEGKKESNEPFAVPTAGAFYMHDDRFRDNAGGRHRRMHGGRKLWESKDDRRWGHDKFEEMTIQERHYEEGRRTSRGQHRTRGRNRGPDRGSRGRRSKPFNIDSNNPNQAPKGVRGRGPRRYEAAMRNSNQAPSLQNKQSRRTSERSSQSGRAFMPSSNAESDPIAARKQVFASSLSSASPPFYPSSSSNKDVSLTQKKGVQSGNMSKNHHPSGVDENFTVQHGNTIHRGKNIADVNIEKLHISDSTASAAGKVNMQMPSSSQLRARERGAYQPAPSSNQANRVSPPTQVHAAVQRFGQSRVQASVQAPSQQSGQHSASGSRGSSPPKAASSINSYDLGEVESPSESGKSKGALVGKGKGSVQGRGPFMYSGAQVMGATGSMSVAPADQNFPAFLPVMQFGSQHSGGMGVPAVGMAFPGYVAQPQLGMGSSEMTWLPILAGAAGALGGSYCPPYLVDGAYHARPSGQTPAIGSSSKEDDTGKPSNEVKPSERPETGREEQGQQQNKPQPRRYSAMNLANDVLR